MRSTRLFVSVVVCLLLLSARTIFAQAALDCATLVSQSLADFSQNCRNLENDSLCYGHKSVLAQTNSSASARFENPMDHLPLNTVESFASSAANLTTEEWGLALANMIPADSTNAVNMLLMGDAKISLAPTVPTSLQISTGFGTSDCGEAPSVAAIGTTSETPAALKINGIDAQAHSLVVFQQESANAIKAIVYNGSFAVNGGGTAQAGQTLAGVMDNNGIVLFWSAPRPTNENEQKVAQVVVNALNGLGITQFAPVVAPTATPLPPTAVPASAESCGDGVTHVVQPGENLFRIALRYGTSIGTVQKANNIADMNQIVVGQTLVIPCGVDSGTSSVAPGNNNDNGSQPTAAPSEDGATPAPAATIQTIDCSGFNGSLPANAPSSFQQLFNQFCSHP
ncbi:MAG: LysM peptidoglycan-binding domain-containing protein [Anaerolineaceae bacterium]|nr:LysM peptidoglycan-binding domain-containing protein [Anaerolineaceae bacterium]